MSPTCLRIPTPPFVSKPTSSSPVVTVSGTQQSESKGRFHFKIHRRIIKKFTSTKSSVKSSDSPKSTSSSPTWSTRYGRRLSSTFVDPFTGTTVSEAELDSDNSDEDYTSYLKSNPPVLFEESETYLRKLKNNGKQRLNADGIFTLRDPSSGESIEDMDVREPSESDGLTSDYALVKGKRPQVLQPKRSMTYPGPFSVPQVVPRTLGASRMSEDTEDDDSYFIPRNYSTSDMASISKVLDTTGHLSPYDSLPRVSTLHGIKDLQTSPFQTPRSILSRTTSYGSMSDYFESTSTSCGLNEFKVLDSQIQNINNTKRVRFDRGTSNTYNRGHTGFNLRNAERVIEMRGTQAE